MTPAVPEMSAAITLASRVRTQLDLDEMYLSADLTTIEKLEKSAEERPQKLQIVWLAIFNLSLIHLVGLCGFYHLLLHASWPTVLWAIFLHFFSTIGITAGSHRLWTHRSYKAKLPTRIMLMIATTVAFQNGVIEWVHDHRCHHKWTDTDADPYNSRRGFFYSHVGWLFTMKLPQFNEMGAKIDMSDLYADPVLVFQEKHLVPMAIIWCFLLPAAIPVYFWGEDPVVAFTVAVAFRYAFSLNITWLINSAAHIYGNKPYDASISPVECSFSNLLTAGEGGHNYHHTFPQDYRTSEFGWTTNWTHAVLDFLAWTGQIYDRKIATPEMVARQMSAKGDGTRMQHHNH